MGAAAKVNDFCAVAGPVPPLLPIDIASNIGSSANSLPGAFRALYNNPGASVEHLFTRAKNCPTHAVRCLSERTPAHLRPSNDMGLPAACIASRMSSVKTTAKDMTLVCLTW